MGEFERVVVTFNVEGGTRVVWSLNRRFTDPLPHSYQLQAALTSTPTADDWEDVGSAVDNGFYAIDDERRLAGKTLEVHYRIVLTTSRGVYYSDPASALTYLNTREWLHARDQLRQLKKIIRKYTGVYEGYLLKRKRFGPPCTKCLDPLTETVTDSKCPICFGTAVLAGYYRGVEDFWVEITNEEAREHVDNQTVGTTKPMTLTGFCAADILVNSRDVFHSVRSGRRWSIETVKTLAEYRGYPTKYQLELRQLPFSDVVYTVPLAGS